jgi:hypothetical protein
MFASLGAEAFAELVTEEPAREFCDLKALLFNVALVLCGYFLFNI